MYLVSKLSNAVLIKFFMIIGLPDNHPLVTYWCPRWPVKGDQLDAMLAELNWIYRVNPEHYDYARYIDQIKLGVYRRGMPDKVR